MRLHFRLGLSFLVVGSAAFAFSQATPEEIGRIAVQGKEKSQAKKTLESLATDVGARVTGSRALERAFIWAVKKMVDNGATNVRLEQWGTVNPGWDRGKRQSGKMVSPYTLDFVFSTNCWTVGTTGPVRGPAVVMPKTQEELDAVKGQLKGAWVLMPEIVGMGGAALRTPNALDKAADAIGIAGRVYRTNGELVWTSGRWNTYTDETRPKTPLVSIRKSDYEMVLYNLERKRKTELEFDIENIFTKRDFPQYNVIGEIRGSEKPDEVVIVCGHLDSWNGPNSQGACDNGTGTTATLETLRILAKSGVKPKRTIRFILWTGEEQGLLGSSAYVEKHKDELPSIQALLNEDSGQNPHAAIVGLDSMMAILNRAVEPVSRLFPDMPVVARQVERMPRGGSDHGPFVARGVPAFFLQKRPDQPYSFVWHTQNDRTEYVPEANLKQMATNLAVLAYNLANSPERLPRVPLAATVYDPHAVGGHSDREDGQCTCGLPFELGLRLSRLAIR